MAAAKRTAAMFLRTVDLVGKVKEVSQGVRRIVLSGSKAAAMRAWVSATL